MPAESTADMLAAPVLLGNEEQWKAHGQLAKEARAREDFLTVTMELEQCKALLPACEKTAKLLAGARKATSSQFMDVLPRTLFKAGFVQTGPNMFSHMSKEICANIELHDPLEHDGNLSQCLVITVDNHEDPEGFADLVAFEMQAHPDCKDLGTSLLNGIQNMVHMAGPQADPQEGTMAPPLQASDYEARALAKLPSPEELCRQIWGAGSTRRLTARPLSILTWGDDIITKNSDKLKAAQHHFNAKPLNGRGGGANTRYNALQDPRIMLNVAESLAEGHGLQMLQTTVRKIEQDDLKCISIYCSKGRHRSVSMAELIHRLYYPGGSVKHLTIS